MVYILLKNKILEYGKGHVKDLLRERLQEDIKDINISNKQVLEIIEQDLKEGASLGFVKDIAKNSAIWTAKKAWEVTKATPGYIKNKVWTNRGPKGRTITGVLALSQANKLPYGNDILKYGFNSTLELGKDVTGYSVNSVKDLGKDAIDYTVDKAADTLGLKPPQDKPDQSTWKTIGTWFGDNVSTPFKNFIEKLPSLKSVGLVGLASVALASLLGVLYIWKQNKQEDCSKLKGPERDSCELKLVTLTISKLKSDRSNCDKSMDEKSCQDEFDKLITEFTNKKNTILNSRG